MLLLKNFLFTLIVPGFLVAWLPFRVFERRARWPEDLNWHHLGGLALLMVGAGVYFHCQWLLMRRGRGTPLPIDPPRHLVQRGLYRWVRNPLYLGLLLVIAGEALFCLSLGIAIYWICLACVFQVFVHLFEEPDLGFRFGAMYEDYKRAVPRWLPRPPCEEARSIPLNRER